jgi:hypothetical protein
MSETLNVLSQSETFAPSGCLDSMAVTASARRSVDGRLRGPRFWVGGLLGGIRFLRTS